ncbi:hypothetical protein [Arundinibacter roseus]|nr:hypothetical protein [Arundinibacter roseus]
MFPAPSMPETPGIRLVTIRQARLRIRRKLGLTNVTEIEQLVAVT